MLTLASGVVAPDGSIASGGVETVTSGGHANGTRVLTGGTQVLWAGGIDTETGVLSGGTLTLAGEVIAARETQDTLGELTARLMVSAVLLVRGARLALSDTTVLSGGTELVESFGLASQTTIRSGGREIVQSRGTTTGSVVSSGGSQTIDLGGVGSDTLLLGGYGEGVFGSAIRTRVCSGAHETVESGGVTSVAQIAVGGAEGVGAGGVASRTTLFGGGQWVDGVAVGTHVSSGGREWIASGGVTSSAVVDAGGREVVLAGGRVLGGLTLSGGTAVMSGAMAAEQTVSFVGAGGVLELANLPAFGAAISGLTLPSQQIDLDGFVYHSATETVSWTQSGASGTLTVNDGAKIATLDLIGTYATSDFQLSSDGHGGTFVDDPPRAATFAQTVAGFASGDAGAAPPIAGGAITSGAPLLTAAGASAGLAH